MKKYLRFLLFGFIALIIIATVLDFAYTFVYKHSKSNRSAFQIVRDLKNNKIDYILLGSSRVIHHLNTALINENYHLNGMNLSLDGTRLKEILLFTEALIANNNHIDKLFIQIDYIWNYYENSFVASWVFMPFIHDEYIANEYLDQFEKIKYNIPFYRYIKYEPMLGFRNIVMNIFRKKSLSETGFEPLPDDVFIGDTEYFYTLNDTMNPSIAKIIELCKQNDIKLIFYTAPIYNLKANNEEIFNKYLSDYTDFSSIFSDSTLFRDAIHLNKKGAMLFTEYFGKHYFE